MKNNFQKKNYRKFKYWNLKNLERRIKKLKFFLILLKIGFFDKKLYF